MMSLAQIIKHLKSTITNYTNFINSKSIENYATTKIINYINGTEGGAKSIRNVLKDRTFKNLPPKIGYFNETTVPLIANFNMSINVDAPWVISDDQGRELMYFPAKGSPSDSTKVFRAYRMSTGSGFIYENEPIIPGYLKNNGKYLVNIYGLENQYMVASTTDGKIHVINTFGEPDNWTLEADITSIVQTGGVNICSIIYFKEYETVYLAGQTADFSTVCGALFNAKTGQLIKKDTVFSTWSVITAQNPSMYDRWDTNSSAKVAIYNRETSELAWMFRTYIFWKDSQNISRGAYHSIFVLADCPKEHFIDGRGTLTNKIPDSEYKITSHKKGMCQEGDSGYRHATYDTLEKSIRTVWRYQNSDSIRLYTRKANDPFTHGCQYFFGGQQTANIQSSDASPWAKRLKTPLVINEETYLYATSKKYGERFVHVEFDTDANGNCSIKPGTWWLSGQNGDMGDPSKPRITCVKTGNSAKYYYLDTDNVLKEFKTESFTADGYTKYGKRSLVATSVKAPTPPSNYEPVSWIYNPKWNKWFFVVRKNGTAIPRELVLLEFDIATSKWTEHYDNRPENWKLGAKESYATRSDFCNGAQSTNAFVDDDGTTYFKVYFTTLTGGLRGTLVKLTKNGSQLTMTQVGGTVLNDVYNEHNASIGWNNKYHYYFTWQAWAGTQECRIYATKHWGSSPDKPNGMKSLLEENNYYTWRFVCASATGMVCYLQDTPVFLGGYFSTVPAKEIPLKPNSANYIYFHRNSDDYKVVDVEVTQSPRNDVDGFNRIYLTKVVTNADGPVSQEYNQIDNYHKKK